MCPRVLLQTMAFEGALDGETAQGHIEKEGRITPSASNKLNSYIHLFNINEGVVVDYQTLIITNIERRAGSS